MSPKDLPRSPPGPNHGTHANMKRMLKDWGVAIGLAVAVYVIIGWFQPAMDLPDEAPTFVVQTLDGEPWDLGAKRGQVVVINFWATWCAPCRKEIPDFSRFAAQHPEVSVIGLSMDDGAPAKVRATAKQLGVRYPIAMADGRIRSAYNVRSLPTTVILDAAGQVLYVRSGTMSYGDLVRAVEKAPG